MDNIRISLTPEELEIIINALKSDPESVDIKQRLEHQLTAYESIRFD